MLLENLIIRARIVRTIRGFFGERGFIEVTTPVRIAAPAPEPHIDCPVSGKEFLRASPELQMKKLLAFGMDKIYQLGPCFREGELGSRHNPEFTMLEWYRKDATYKDIKKDITDLINVLQPGLKFTTLTVREAYLQFAGWDPWAEWDQDRFDFDMATKIEPELPNGIVFLTDYPPDACSLAKLNGGIAERWEMYWDRLELANCFTELCDGKEQRLRFEKAKAERKVLGESDYPLDEEFLELLPLIESAAGVALGVDRLVMKLTDTKTIQEVL